MSYNMRVLPLPDDDIQQIARNPRVLEQSVMVDAATELYDQWRDIDYILGGQSFLETSCSSSRSTSRPTPS